MKDLFNYHHKVCIVTGASSGMGKSATKYLVDLGAKVYALDVNDCPVNGIEKFIKVNLADKEAIDEVFKQIPHAIDCFFGIAGLSGSKTDYRTTFHVNYTSNMVICEKYLKDRMNENGSILFVTSTAGVAWREQLDECNQILGINEWDKVNEKLDEIIPEGTPGQMAYMYSKRLANAYSAKLAVELGTKKIRVNAILPGSTDTGMKDEFAKMAGGIENMIKFAGLAGRLAESDEMGKPIVFLNSDMASFISGEELIIDYCDNAMKKLKLKPEFLNGPALMDKETLMKMLHKI